MAYIPIASQTLSAAASSVTFSSIPTTINGKTLRDLVLVARNVTSGTIGIRLNGSTSNIYTSVRMSGNGSSPTSGTQSNTFFSPAFWCDPGSGFSLIMDVFDFSQTNKHKSVLFKADNAGNGSERFASRWADTAAVTSIVFYEAGGGNLNSGGTYALYGIEG